MSDLAEHGKTFQIIMRGMMDTGHAPHYTDIAKDLGVSPDEGRKRLHELDRPKDSRLLALPKYESDSFLCAIQ